MTRLNLAVCFGPVIFSLNYDNKKKLKSPKSHLSSATSSVGSGGVGGGLTKPPMLTIPNAMLLQSSSQSESESSNTGNNTNRKYSEQITGKSRYESNLFPMIEQPKRSSMFEAKSGGINALVGEQLQQQQRTSTTAGALLSVPNAPLQDKSSSPIAMTSAQMMLQSSAQTTTNSGKSSSTNNYKKKFNKAASSIVNFGAELSMTSKSSALFSVDSSSSSTNKENLESMEYLSRVVQTCVHDMIKYSMDLFTVIHFIL